MSRRRLTQRSDEPVRLARYDPRWQSRFEIEREPLTHAIGDQLTGGIHHVGSTAVPGLEAKPTVDILVGVASLRGSRRCFGELERLDYFYAPYRADEMHWFCKPHPSRRTHHLHLVPTDSKRFRDEIAFRDHLRADPGLATKYATLKRRLVARFTSDREAYTSAKGEFIASVLHGERARSS